MSQAVVRSFTDSHIRKDMPDRSFTISHLLRVAGAQRADEGHAFLWCPRPFPLGAVITNAVLRVRSRDVEPPGAATLRLWRVADQFTITEATWANQPEVVPGMTEVSNSATPQGTLWEFDVTSHMRAISSGSAWWGFRLSTPTNALVRLFSADSSGSNPELTVEWSDQPSQPTGLMPSADLAVTKDKPTLSYVFSDVSGDTSLALSRVQIHTEPTTTGSPLWSGEVASSEPVIDLEDTDFPGMALGARRCWRVSAQDGAGLNSTWSDWAWFRRVAKPSMTITSPTDGAIVENPTPTIRWSVSSGQQQSFQVLVWDEERRTRFFTSGRVIASSTRAYQLPAGVLKRDDERYRIEVRVWDDVRRAPQPGEVDFNQQVVFVTFDRDGSLTPVTTEIAPTDDQVGMVVSWTRAQDPGSFAILRDGDIIEVVDSSDARVGTNRWSFTDWAAHPRRDHTWEVAPIVNEVAGRGTPVAGRLQPRGVWLVWGDGIRVMVTEDDTPSGWGMLEQSTSHTPLGARIPVVITQALGGYAGTTKGQLSGLDHVGGPSAQDQRDVFLRLKERQGQTMRFIVADQNLPVTTWNMAVSPAPAGRGTRFNVTFDWAQVAEFDFEPVYL